MKELTNDELYKKLDDFQNKGDALFAEYMGLVTEFSISSYIEGYSDGMNEIDKRLKEEMCSKCRSAKLNDCHKCEWGEGK